MNRRKLIAAGAAAGLIPLASTPAVSRDEAKREILRRLLALGWDRDVDEPFRVYVSLYLARADGHKAEVGRALAMLDRGEPVEAIYDYLREAERARRPS